MVTFRTEQAKVTTEAQDMKKNVYLLITQEFLAVSKPPTVSHVKVQ
jgi:hypothetical protein